MGFPLILGPYFYGWADCAIPFSVKGVVVFILLINNAWPKGS